MRASPKCGPNPLRAFVARVTNGAQPKPGHWKRPTIARQKEKLAKARAWENSFRNQDKVQLGQGERSPKPGQWKKPSRISTKEKAGSSKDQRKSLPKLGQRKGQPAKARTMEKAYPNQDNWKIQAALEQRKRLIQTRIKGKILLKVGQRKRPAKARTMEKSLPKLERRLTWTCIKANQH